MSGFVGWLNQPFSTDMSAARWFAWVGLLLAALIIWTMVLKNLEAL